MIILLDILLKLHILIFYFYLQNVTSTKYVDTKNELINKVHALGKYADNVVVA
jgi:hypothetical protein